MRQGTVYGRSRTARCRRTRTRCRSRAATARRFWPRTPVAVEKVRYVGEPVAVVIAETLAQAMDAAEHLAVVDAAPPAVVRSRRMR